MCQCRATRFLLRLPGDYPAFSPVDVVCEPMWLQLTSDDETNLLSLLLFCAFTANVCLT